MKISYIITLALMMVIWTGNTARPEVPQFINYQGLLASPSGVPLDTTLTMTFILYDDSVGGNALWIESHEDVEVIRGVFHVVLGQETTFELGNFDSPGRYLGIKIGLNPMISPRVRVVSVPYTSRAVYSDNSNSVDDRSSADFLNKSDYDSDGDGLVDVAAVDAIGVPVGIVIDWWRPDESFPVPTGFIICDGSMVDDSESPFYGFALPDLTDLLIRGVSDTTEIGQTGGDENHSHSMVYASHQHETALDHDHPFYSRMTLSAGLHTHEWDASHLHTATGTSTDGYHSHWYFSSSGPYKYSYSGLFPGGSAGGHYHTIEVPAYDGRGSWTGGSGEHYHSIYADYPLYADTVLTSVDPDTTLFSSDDSSLPPYVGLLKIMRIK